MQPRTHPALHRLEIHLGQLHPAARHKLVLEQTLPDHLQLRPRELRRERAERGVAHLRPPRRRRDPRRNHQPLPEPLRHGERTPRRNLLLRIILPHRLQLPHERFARVRAGPIHAQQKRVVHRRQLARAPRRQLQDRRPAQPPMRDQQRPVRPQLRARHAHRRVLHRHSRQPDQPRVVDVKREQRRHRRLDRVPERLRDREPRRRLVSARRQQQPFAAHPGIVRQRQPKIRPRALHLSHAHARDDLHARRFRRPHQTIHNRRRVICHRKHATVRLGFRFHAALGEPRDHVARLKLVEGSEQLPAAARIFFHQLARLEARVRDVAAPAARHAHLRERMRRGLVNRHFAGRAELLRAGDGREKSRRPAPDHHHAPFVCHGPTLRRARRQRQTFLPRIARLHTDSLPRSPGLAPAPSVKSVANTPGFISPARFLRPSRPALRAPAHPSAKRPSRAAIRDGQTNP